MERLLDDVVPEAVQELCQRFQQAGFRAWLVGGCVRDELLLGMRAAGTELLTHERNDWDIATDAHPEQTQRLFKRVIPTGIQHGTVTVMVGKVGYEVTTLRGEHDYSDGRRPDAVFFIDDIQADLARRDFTMNAIAYDVVDRKLIDPFGGVEDLKRRIIRAVGDPHARFREDGLRVLRAARFVATLEATLDEATERAILPSLASYRKVSPERVRDEWLKTLKAFRPSRGFRVMRSEGLLDITCPELASLDDENASRTSVWEQTLFRVDACSRDQPALRLAALFLDVHRSAQAKRANHVYMILGRLRFSNKIRDQVCHILKVQPPPVETANGGELRRWLSRASPGLFMHALELARADASAHAEPTAVTGLERLQARLKRELEGSPALVTGQLAISGTDLIELGVPKGPEIGRLLNALLERVLDDPSLNEKQRLLAAAVDLRD